MNELLIFLGADSISGALACILEQFQYTPIATQRVVFNGIESAAYGSLIISSMTASSVRNISSITNMRVGVGFVQSAGTYELSYQVEVAAKPLITHFKRGGMS
jgi:hypothetical protein